MQQIKKYRGENGKVGDIGVSTFSCLCGTQIGFENFSAIIPKNTFVDYSLPCAEKLSYLVYDVTDGTTGLEKQGNFNPSFDVVVFSEVMEHIMCNDEIIIDNVRKLLKPGGVLILTVPNIASLWNRIRLLMGRNVLGSKSEILHGVFGGYGHLREYTPNEIKDIVLKCGFKIVSLGGFNGYGGEGIIGKITRVLLNALPSSLSFHIVCIASREV